MHELFINFLEKCRKEFSNKCIFSANIFVQEKIIHFDLNKYLKNNNFSIKKTNPT